MIFNVCLVIFITISFLITYAGLGSIIQKINLLIEAEKKTQDILNTQAQIDECIKKGLEDIMHNTICIYHQVEKTDKCDCDKKTSKPKKSKKKDISKEEK